MKLGYVSNLLGCVFHVPYVFHGTRLSVTFEVRQLSLPFTPFVCIGTEHT